MVQWLRLSTPNAGRPGSIPGQGPRSHMPQQRPGTAKINKQIKKKKKKTHTFKKQMVLYKCWVIKTIIIFDKNVLASF